ncbi:MAG: NUDIX hydrolase [Candidatus Gracilibacteria bacterium]|nr:NUDIX hydrolase [Candidatus Gracilibacteria bacterium]
MKNNGPWKIISSEIKYKNPWIEVQEDKVIRPDGKDGIFGTVKMLDGISILPIDNNGNVYITREFKYGLGEESFEVVSGGIDENENHLDCAKRELKEELGIIAENITYLGVVNPFTSVIKSKAYLYLAQDISFTKSKNDGTETIKLTKLPLQEVYNMVISGKITHGPSCVLILKAYYYLTI